MSDVEARKKAEEWAKEAEIEVCKRLEGASYACTCPSPIKAYLAGYAEGQKDKEQEIRDYLQPGRKWDEE